MIRVHAKIRIEIVAVHNQAVVGHAGERAAKAPQTTVLRSTSKNHHIGVFSRWCLLRSFTVGRSHSAAGTVLRGPPDSTHITRCSLEDEFSRQFFGLLRVHGFEDDRFTVEHKSSW